MNSCRIIRGEARQLMKRLEAPNLTGQPHAVYMLAWVAFDLTEQVRRLDRKARRSAGEPQTQFRSQAAEKILLAQHYLSRALALEKNL